MPTAPPVAATNSSESAVRRTDEAQAAPATETTVNEPASAPPTESLSAQWQRAMANGGQPKPEVVPPRVSQREQLAQVAEHPFVRRAMELFDVAPGQFRYTPPKNEAN
jgi:hypothetical protein